MANILKQFGETLEKTIPGFIAVSVLDIDKGINHYSKVKSGLNYNIDLDSSYVLEMVRAKINGIESVNGVQRISDITVSLTSEFHIVNLSDDQRFLYYLVVDAEQANLTMTKALLMKCKKELV